ncbi:MAG: hypothetical protein V3U54_13360 [Thermodesulfobacteriota bacterium]
MTEDTTEYEVKTFIYILPDEKCTKKEHELYNQGYTVYCLDMCVECELPPPKGSGFLLHRPDLPQPLEPEINPTEAVLAEVMISTSVTLVRSAPRRTSTGFANNKQRLVS